MGVPRILIDTNILMDYVTQREPYFVSSQKILNACVEGKTIGSIAAHSIPNMFYILRKTINIETRRKMLINLCTILDVEDIDKTKLILALNDADFLDFEDCLQEKCAVFFKADYIITRNPKDYKSSSVNYMEPDKFLEILFSEQKNQKTMIIESEEIIEPASE